MSDSKAKSSAFSRDFYKRYQTNLESAKVVVPLVVDLVRPASVVDVGCGTAPWLHVFSENGVKDVLGVDGDWIDENMLFVPKENFKRLDLDKPFDLGRKFDLVMTLEVAEHLPHESSETFVQSLTSHSPVVMFSCAIPHQGGTRHINEQWPEYWVERFAKRNFVPVDCIRSKVWNDKRVSYYYAQNILLFVEKGYLQNSPALQAELEKSGNSILSLVHPEKYEKVVRGITRYALAAKVSLALLLCTLAFLIVYFVFLND